MLFNLAAVGLLLTGVLATDITRDFDWIYQPTEGQVVEAGSTVEIAWKINNTAKYGDVKVDILVIGGKDPGTLVPKDTIATGLDNSDLKYKWHVKKSLGDEKLYGIEIVLSSDDSVLAYSPGFSIKKAGDVDSGTTSTGTTTMTATTESDSASTSTTKTSATKKTTTSTSKSETDGSTPTPTPTTDASSTTVATTSSGTPSNAAVGGPKAVPGMVAAAVGCVAMMAI
ncbi:hypothetical protein NLG97_g3567 [Lecanicillium saksenae]|uniref:Uncharacterized protein n=1 Tax=Lecanicillium saksenae TaxID=468837 RepID=A0ACC1R107_9HYPO|nr:hypothetical protein NLG97_g3567 [Lecanicillium saksenae]